MKCVGCRVSERCRVCSLSIGCRVRVNKRVEIQPFKSEAGDEFRVQGE